MMVTLLAGPAAADPALPGGTFTDDDGNVHEGYIEAIASAGITRGCNPPSNYYYCPRDPVTRGQMAAFLTRALNLSRATGDAFTDDGDSVFESDINALASAGITRGCNPPANTRFCPDQPVTRGQMAAFLVRAFHFTAGAGRNNFDDDDGSTFEGDIDRLAAAGITRGCDPPSNTRYCPEDPVLRDQMATFLARSLGLDPNTPPPAGNRRVIARDTLIEDERLVLRRGDSLEFRNGARLMIGEGASVDWQGTPTTTWSDDGKAQNLRRDVRIFGQGDIMFMEGSQSSTIRFVELDLQPIDELGHYPLHWHFAGEGARGTLVEGVVIKNSTNRAFVPHASHGIRFKDTIAKNIIRQAYWWDPPADQTGETIHNSNDIMFDHVLADGVKSLRVATGERDGQQHHRMSAFLLGAGSGNTVRNSAAINIRGGSSCSGYHWPSAANHNPGGNVWTFENNFSQSGECHGIFVWQNNAGPHIIDGFRGTVFHGAYKNDYDYRNVDANRVDIWAGGWSMTGGTVKLLVAGAHNKIAPQDPTFLATDVAVGSFVIANGQGSGGVPGIYELVNSGLACSDIVHQNVVPGTRAILDGVECPVP
jgi:hypothetical protein